MTTVLQARPRRFVSTPTVERIAARALRYLQSGFSVHLRGPSGTGKTTLALHLADLLSRPIMLVFGDDEYKTSDLVGNQSGYTRKKVVDNFIHNVVKVEDELRQNWVDSRLTLACRDGFTLVYDEFNRSRPEVNNVLLSALEEKLLVLPPSGNRSEYIQVNPHFRVIFTSNPEEYCGVHNTQDALLDRVITINVPEPDELTQQEILVQKTHLEREDALQIVRFVSKFRAHTQTYKTSGLRAGLIIGKICQEHGIPVLPSHADFRDLCSDVLLSRSKLPLEEATPILWNLFNEWLVTEPPTLALETPDAIAPVEAPMTDASHVTPTIHQTADNGATEALPQQDSSTDWWDDAGLDEPEPEAIADFAALEPATEVEPAAEPAAEPYQASDPGTNLSTISPDISTDSRTETTAETTTETTAANTTLVASRTDSPGTPYQQEVYQFLQEAGEARVSEIELALNINRFQVVNALRSLANQGLLVQRDRLEIPAVYRPHAMPEQRQL